MTIGIGGSSAEIELTKLNNMTDDVTDIKVEEFAQRITKAQLFMQQQGIDALYLNAGTNLYYFTGTRWYASERMVGAIIPKQGEVEYICPTFEINTLAQYQTISGRINSWQEHESPYELLANVLQNKGLPSGKIAIDESTAYFIVDGIKKHTPQYELVNAFSITSHCRSQKSPHELSLLQRAKDMTLTVHKAAAKILHPGISTSEVEQFIHQAHKKVGAPAGSYFCIVLFGEDSSYPHGVKNPKTLEQDDIVLIDTGCQLYGYNSDITRTYVFGKPNDKQRKVWQIEKNAQLKAFEAAKLGAPCADVDIAARQYIAGEGMGPDYQTPGCPHRTGHGIGLDIHEAPYLVRNDLTPLAPGMCFSNEPMLVIPNEFGVRLEDHFYMAKNGPKWFTEPSHSIDDPFGYAVDN